MLITDSVCNPPGWHRSSRMHQQQAAPLHSRAAVANPQMTVNLGAGGQSPGPDLVGVLLADWSHLAHQPSRAWFRRVCSVLACSLMRLICSRAAAALQRTRKFGS